MGFATSANHSKLASSTSFIIFPKLQSEYVYDKVMNKIYLSIALPVQPLARLELEWSVVLEVMPYIIKSNRHDASAIRVHSFACARHSGKHLHRNNRKSQASSITSWYHLCFVLLAAPWLTLQVAPETEMRRAVPGVFHCFSKRHSRLCSSHPCAAWNMLSCPGKLSEISSTLQTCSSGQELQGQ